jgi:hypothetical protein
LFSTQLAVKPKKEEDGTRSNSEGTHSEKSGKAKIEEGT